MATTKRRPSLLVIVGPTASGKSALAHRLARKYNGEIISADSRAIYKDMDIGTAKPAPKEQKGVPYWGLDLVEPGQKFSAKQFQRYAKRAIKDVQKRGKLPLLVGGSGLYIDSILFDYSFLPNTSRDPINPRHRLIGSYAKNQKIANGILIVGLLPSIDELRSSIKKRTDKMFTQGVVNETKLLMLKYGKKALLSSTGIAYLACLRLLDGELNLAQTKELAATKEYQYARRQKTWFKRNKNIKWFENSELAQAYIEQLLNT